MTRPGRAGGRPRSPGSDGTAPGWTSQAHPALAAHLSSHSADLGVMILLSFIDPQLDS